LKHLRKGIVERMMRVLGRSGPRVVSLSPCFRGSQHSSVEAELASHTPWKINDLMF
jgi:hypothetical protein